MGTIVSLNKSQHTNGKRSVKTVCTLIKYLSTIKNNLQKYNFYTVWKANNYNLRNQYLSSLQKC